MAANLQNINTRSSRRRNSRVISEINVTPLVDVMLVLLIIFMVTSPMLVAGVEVDLPQASSQPVAGQDEPLSLTIKSDGSVYLMDSRVLRKDLISKLNAITKQKRDTRIFIRGDKKTSYGSIIDVMSYITDAGFNKVALITNSQIDKD